MKKVITVIIATTMLAACGGGGGGGNSVSSRNTGIASRPAANTNAPFPYDSTQGTPSNFAGAVDGFRTFYEAEFSDTLTSSQIQQLKAIPQANFLNEVHSQSMIATRDTRADAAWRSGWTGKGVKVGHLDDFQTKDIPFNPDGILTLKSHGGLTRLVTFQVAPEIDHSARQLTLTCSVTDTTQRNQITSGYNHFNQNGYHIVNNSWGSSRYDDGSCSGSPGLASLTEWRNGIALYKSEQILLNVAQGLDKSGSYDRNMLFVFAAGNYGRNCAGGIANCNLYAATLNALRRDGDTEAGKRAIFVGAVADGNSNRLAPYSQSAGAMGNDYIVTHDDVLYRGDFEGTSFAAPRVAGAAALVRHKFPNLDGPALKQVLLQTADDLGAPGVDSIFGHGKLNVLNALSPIGRVRAR